MNLTHTTARGETFHVSEKVSYENGPGGLGTVATIVGFGRNSFGTTTFLVEFPSSGGGVTKDQTVYPYISKLDTEDEAEFQQADDGIGGAIFS